MVVIEYGSIGRGGGWSERESVGAWYDALGGLEGGGEERSGCGGEARLSW